MFAYCLNNPVEYEDSNGLSPVAICAEAILLAIIAVAASAAGIPLIEKASKTASITWKKQDDERIYSVYFLKDKESVDDTIVYVGRVKTSNFNSRMAYHNSKGRAYVFSIDNLTYSECRFIEQAGMIWCHTIDSNNPLANQIRGIGPTNAKIQNYIDAAIKLFNGDWTYEDIFPLSYFMNQKENYLLNGF